MVASLPFLTEAQTLIQEIHHSAAAHNTWRNADDIGNHLVDAVAIAVQRFTGEALSASIERQRAVAMGARAA